MNKYMFRKILVVGIIAIFICVSLAPAISSASFKSNKNENQDTSPFTFYTFDKSGIKQKEVTLPKDIAENIFNKFEELKQRFSYDPLSDETKTLQIEFIDMLDLYGLIPQDLSKEDLLSLLNPPWINFLKKILEFTSKSPFIKSPVLNFNNKNVNINEDNFKSKKFNEEKSLVRYVLLSNVASYGLGIPFPLFMLPRPRGFAVWVASDASTYVGSLIQGESFTASGNQQALALGFMGFGLSVYIGWFVYALIGYSGLLIINADVIK